MKAIRNILMAMLVMLFAISACQQENVTPDSANALDVGTQDIITGDTTNSDYGDDDDDDGEYEEDDDDN